MRVTIVIDNPDRRRIALMVLHHRLKLEIKFKWMTEGGDGRFTMQSVKGWGFKGRTRKQALEWVDEQLLAY